jgi:uncharacterized membrane protein YtjA (UPF0391 family)
LYAALKVPLITASRAARWLGEGLTYLAIMSENSMLYWVMIFFVITIFAALFGFTSIAVGAASVAKIIFLVFLFLFAFTLTFEGTRRNGPGG